VLAGLLGLLLRALAHLAVLVLAGSLNYFPVIPAGNAGGGDQTGRWPPVSYAGISPRART
jgi:hypothetical protein